MCNLNSALGLEGNYRQGGILRRLLLNVQNMLFLAMILFPFSPFKSLPLLPLPNSSAIDLQKHNNSTRRKRNSSLNPQHLRGPNLLHPRQLDIRRHKPSPDPPHRHPSTHLAGIIGVAVQQVRVHGRGADHDPAALHGRKDGQNHVMPVSLNPQPDDDETYDHDDGGGVGDGQARFGQDAPTVPLGVEIAEGVVHPVADEPADCYACDAEEVEEA